MLDTSKIYLCKKDNEEILKNRKKYYKKKDKKQCLNSDRKCTR